MYLSAISITIGLTALYFSFILWLEFIHEVWNRKKKP
jgi:hypothetical protein